MTEVDEDEMLPCPVKAVCYGIHETSQPFCVNGMDKVWWQKGYLFLAMGSQSSESTGW